LITATAGSSNSETIRPAASTSSRLVNESSLPWTIVTSSVDDVRLKPDAPVRSHVLADTSGALMRILAVSQVANLLQGNRQTSDRVRSARFRRHHIRVRPGSVPTPSVPALEAISLNPHVRQRVGNGGVVRRRVSNGLPHQVESKLDGRRRIERVEQPTVVLRIDDDKDVGEVLAAALTSDGPPISIPRSFREMVYRIWQPRPEMDTSDDDHVHERDCRAVRARQDDRADRGARRMRVYGRMERFHTAIEHFRESCKVGDAGDGEPAPVRVRAVPPVDTRSKPRRVRPCAKSSTPVLSETLSKALA